MEILAARREKRNSDASRGLAEMGPGMDGGGQAAFDDGEGGGASIEPKVGGLFGVLFSKAREMQILGSPPKRGSDKR